MLYSHIVNKAQFKAGDTIKVYTKDPQDNKVHATPFQGTVIAVKGGKKQKTITLRKGATGGVAVERIFPIDSPIIEKIDIVKKGQVRRAKLYYLRKK